MDHGNYRRGGGGGNRGRGRGGGNSEQEQGRGGGRGGPQMGSYNQQPPFQPPQLWGNQPRASGPGQYQGRGAPYNQQGTGQHHTVGQNPGRGGTAWVSRGGSGTAWPRPPPQQQPQQHGSRGGGTAWARPPPQQRQQDVSSGSGTAWIRAPPQQPQQHGGGGGCGNQLQRDVEPSRSGASNVRSRGAPSGSSPSQSSGPIHQMDRQPVKQMAVESQNPDYSHFVSLPLAIYPELVNKLINFQNSVLGITEVSKSPTSESKASELLELGIEKSIFINPKTFHLTVLMLKLWNKDRFEAAAQVLRSVSPKVLDALESRPVSIRLKGLECMRGSPAKAYVVYAPVEVIGGEARLLRACQVIIDAFTEAGLVLEKDANRKLKLHATIMNARHSRSKNRSGNADSFDARAIFGQYGSEEWGEYLIREAHLSQRFVFDDNGYYHCCASIPFPEEMQLD
uniref:A-kinase anchor protein 7 isoforms delta and gamma n=1 Tax=Nicotiana tabacum TaxID=4097 RepID=A0A1S3X6A2_TOBAC|nr:PREDICTED: A-kinase anchor protein 7 isoforms delta and gamma-like [Nicotiana tabacum]XP_016435509.1 PREDICTED: A-kinase anchor protein 7 isoforms delta and gamma-like [Nicotiana tabacum]XP_016435510.1 PREDICTED: A-kinase anchor protein 7 isoforms delta and gamma-like [Nicotiana tabacum]XP_016435511.1 PREDICTED: A-kinase anchor protein 7 isoforms delta and gamma-like [Nicotiana tabacum]XP_016435513.1 PREDICTED: A-kinase anchor protein 7 isoforms delta and gamma-like [Nicotiana tabacum]XP_01